MDFFQNTDLYVLYIQHPTDVIRQIFAKKYQKMMYTNME